jgi:AcrR family transcriptional regulator
MIEMEQSATRERIREQAKQLFMRYGVRSVSMDEIAVGLGMSKKTIYQYFTDKNELVDAIIVQDLQDMKQESTDCQLKSENAVEEIYLAMVLMLEHLRTMNPNLLYDLHKFHFESYKRFLEHKNTYMRDLILRNLQRGVKEGLFRPDINVEVLSTYRVETMMMVFDPDIFPSPKNNMTDVARVISEHFLFGIVTHAGYELILKYQQERNKQTNNENR